MKNILKISIVGLMLFSCSCAERYVKAPIFNMDGDTCEEEYWYDWKVDHNPVFITDMYTRRDKNMVWVNYPSIDTFLSVNCLELKNKRQSPSYSYD